MPRPVTALLFAAYRVAWIALFGIAILSLGYANARYEWMAQRVAMSGMALGMLVYQNNSAEGMLVANFGPEGARLGFRENDLVTSIDGRPVGDDQARRYTLMEGPAGSVATMVVRRPDGSVVTIRAARDPGRLERSYAGWGISFPVRRWIAFAVREIAGIASVAAALLLFLRRPRDRVAQLLSFSLVLGQATIARAFADTPGFVAEGQMAIISVLLTLAVLLFPHGRLRDWWQRSALAIAIVGNAANIAMFLGSNYPVWGPLAFGLPLAFLLYVAVRQLRQTPPGIARQQVKSVLFGVAAYCALLLANAILTIVVVRMTSPAAMSWAVLVSHLCEALAGVAIAAGLLVSLLRFRLYDAETAISRSVAYGALTAILIGVFAASEKIIEIVGEYYMGEGLGALSGALGAAIAAGTMVPLHRRVTHWAERRFQGNLAQLKKGLPALVADLRETASPQAVADAALARVEAGVRATRGAVIAGGAVAATRHVAPTEVEAWLARFDAPRGELDRPQLERGDPLFPLRLPLHADGAGLAGWLVLGPRPDGSVYGRDELDALRDVADPLARALAIATERHAREAAREAGMAKLRQRLDALEAAMQRLLGTWSGSTAT